MIRVLNNYGGRNTKEQRILPGDYSEDDPRLFGLADYLIENGHAVQVTDVAPPVSTETPEEPQTDVYIDEDNRPYAGEKHPVSQSRKPRR